MKYLKADDTILVTKNLYLDKNLDAWIPRSYNSDLEPGTKLIFSYFYFGDYPGLNFTGDDGSTPEFTVDEVEKFLRDGTFVIC